MRSRHALLSLCSAALVSAARTALQPHPRAAAACATSTAAAALAHHMQPRYRLAASSGPAPPPGALHRHRLLSTAPFPRSHIRNIALIAHVDHGKTTLVDCLLRETLQRQKEAAARQQQSSSGNDTAAAQGEDRVMDSNALERERGITILSKPASALWTSTTGDGDGDQSTATTYRFNIVDTPGHSDFGGEVERVLSMVDGVALLVDAAEGPMTQTKYVLGKALAAGLRPVVIVNKIDRDTSRLGDVENEVFDLFVELGASDEQLDFPIVYASAKHNWAALDAAEWTSAKESAGAGIDALFATCVAHVPPPPDGAVDEPFSMLVTQIESSPFFGKMLFGRVRTGSLAAGDSVRALAPDGTTIEGPARVIKVMQRNGTTQEEVPRALAGDLVYVAGLSDASVNATLCAASNGDAVPIPSASVDPPTLSVIFAANDSPLYGQDPDCNSSKLTGTAIRARLEQEVEHNISLVVSPGRTKEETEVRARGELQLGILIETLRREGFELSIFPPRILDRKGDDGERLEPVEEVRVDCVASLSGSIIGKLQSERLAEMVSFTQVEGGSSADGSEERCVIIFHVPSRGFLGYRTEFMLETRGDGTLNHSFHGWVPWMGELPKREGKGGALINMELGKTTSYALESLEARGVLFVSPGTAVYPGMVVGEHSREHSIEVNAVRSKALTNMRAAGKDEKVRLTPPRLMTVEELITYVREDEVIEATPNCLRLRKRYLDAADRKKQKGGGR